MVPITDTLDTLSQTRNIQPSWLPLSKRLVGTIIAYCHDLDMGYRIRTADNGIVDVTLSRETHHPIRLDRGHHVTLSIPPADVMLSPPRWVDPSETNHWAGRVVLASHPDSEPLLIVKILGQPWTLMSSQSISWLNRRPCAWDRVTVHIPPDAVQIIRRYPGHSHLRPRLLTTPMCRNEHHTYATSG